MNKVLMSLALGSFVLVGSSYAQTPPPSAAPASPDASTTATTTAPAATTAPVKPKVVHHHDALHKAIHDLHLAKENLAKVTIADTNGHRAKALSDIEDALTELKASLE